MHARVLGRRFFAVIAFALGLTGGSPAVAQTQTAVEYYYAAWNFYFFTAFADEIAGLDAGAYGGVWKRTGQTFQVWSQAGPGVLPTCRFFSITFAPRSSHFYTPIAAECDGLKSNPNWMFESIAFYLQLPDANGNCPPGTVILYRLYNNGMGGAPNHRFTTSLAIFNQMLAAGWIFEGDLHTYAFACVPAPVTAEGQWDGFTNTNLLLITLVLDDGTFYYLYTTQAGAPSPNVGFVQGTLTYSNGQFMSSDAVDFNFAGAGARNAAVSGYFVPRQSFNGSVTEGLQVTTFISGYDDFYDQPASLSSLPGTYAGFFVSTTSAANASITIAANGTFTGASSGCSFNGTMSPRGSVNVFNLSITFHGGGCSFGSATLIGIAIYEPQSGAVLALAPNATRTDGFMFVGGP